MFGKMLHRGVTQIGTASGLFSQLSCRRCYSLAEAIEVICHNRHAERNFSTQPVSPEIVQNIMKLTQLAPSSFNMQPYKIILVGSSEMKSAVASAMHPGNDRHVLTAAYSMVFVADIGRLFHGTLLVDIWLICSFIVGINASDPARSTRKLMELETQHGASTSYVSSLPAKITMVLGNGWLSNRLRALGTHLVSPLKPTPVIHSSNRAWSVMNAAFAAQQLMLAATAHGLRTLPMEGFDERRLSAVLGISLSEHAIPLVVCMGHSARADDPLPKIADSYPKQLKDGGYCHPFKVRFPLESICYSEKFGNKINIS